MSNTITTLFFRVLFACAIAGGSACAVSSKTDSAGAVLGDQSTIAVEASGDTNCAKLAECGENLQQRYQYYLGLLSVFVLR